MAEATFEAMRRGEPIIFQGVLRDAESRIYGAPDLLVRADVLRELFPNDLSAEAIEVEAPDLPDLGTHYRIVDTKFSQLHLAAGGELGNSGDRARRTRCSSTSTTGCSAACRATRFPRLRRINSASSGPMRRRPRFPLRLFHRQ